VLARSPFFCVVASLRNYAGWALRRPAAAGCGVAPRMVGAKRILHRWV